MRIQENISLKEYNTFGIDVNAAFFAQANSISDLKTLLEHPKHSEKFILGGGSNILLVNDLEALVIQMNMKGIQIESEDENYVQVRVMAGENWHEFVLWCIQQGYGGYENLSLIPGLVGTAPIQNIGAYGVELKDHFLSCQVFDKRSKELVTLSAKKCEFGYRDSVFKSKQEGNYIICSVLFKLSKKNHDLKLTYGDIQKVIEENNWEASIESISKAVISIRESKLPNPAELGNSGSFFKNPIIPVDAYKKMIERYPEMPQYPVSESFVKVPAGWLIEKAGLKGYTQGRVGVHKNQALVLVNYGEALGIEVYELALYVMETIQEKFGIKLEPEVRIIA
jgi:UDP-N-acetylmuramate dehydrogenase